MVRLLVNDDGEVGYIDELGRPSTLRTWLKRLRLFHGFKSAGGLETATGLVHPTIYNFEASNTKHLRIVALIEILDVLGYELIIKKGRT